MTTGTAVMIGLAALAVMICIWLAMSRSAFVKLRDSAEEAFETMDIFLKKRYELVPKLVQTVRNCTKEEFRESEQLSAAGRLAQESDTAEAKAKNEPELAAALEDFFAAAENYPELAANGTFQNLRKKRDKIEEDIANSCRFYNSIAKMLNVRVNSFPSSLAAKVFHITEKPIFYDI